MAQERLGGLDLLRGIAALSVVLIHVSIAYPGVATPFDKAYLAVDFFFMLSGFVLARTYQTRFQLGLGVRRFMTLRLMRLWPTIAIGALIGAVSMADVFSSREIVLLLACNLALVPLFAGGAIFGLNGPIWSILFELLANLFHAGVLARLSQNSLAGLIAMMAVVMIGVAITMDAQGAGPWDVGGGTGNFAPGLPRVILSYTMGCLLYAKWGDRPLFALPPWLAPVLLTAAHVLGSQAHLGWIFDAAFVMLVCPVVLIAGLSSWHRARTVEHVAGDLSFPLYVVHMPILLISAKASLSWAAGVLLAVLAAAIVLRVTRAAAWQWLTIGSGVRSAPAA